MKQERHFTKQNALQAGKWAQRYLELREDNKEYTITIKQRRRRRSLDANACLWVLIDKLAEVYNMSKTDIYRNTIKEVGGVSDYILLQDEAVEKFCKAWKKRGLGWFTETTESKLPNCKTVTVYYGSSSYDTKQMARLIDLVVQECEQAGIEVMSEQELSLLKEQWHDKTNEGASNQ